MKLFWIFLSLVLVISISTSCARVTGRTAGQTIDDSAITGDIKGRILKDSQLGFMQISVKSFQGNVTLSGAVPSKEAEQRAIQLAKEVRGVQSVTSNLVVNPEAGKSLIPGRT